MERRRRALTSAAGFGVLSRSGPESSRPLSVDSVHGSPLEPIWALWIRRPMEISQAALIMSMVMGGGRDDDSDRKYDGNYSDVIDANDVKDDDGGVYAGDVSGCGLIWPYDYMYAKVTDNATISAQLTLMASLVTQRSYYEHGDGCIDGLLMVTLLLSMLYSHIIGGGSGRCGGCDMMITYRC
eukprot:scaffold260204_cov32-Prasinocladus_malaysianus.AAC.1